jgi:hypothetical protein
MEEERVDEEMEFGVNNEREEFIRMTKKVKCEGQRNSHKKKMNLMLAYLKRRDITQSSLTIEQRFSILTRLENCQHTRNNRK